MFQFLLEFICEFDGDDDGADDSDSRKQKTKNYDIMIQAHILLCKAHVMILYDRNMKVICREG